jgi:hypothetical protein
MEVQKKEDGSITLSFYTELPQQKKISIIFPKRTTKNELLIALQDGGGMVLTKGVQYYTKNMLIELYGYNSKRLLHQIYLKSLINVRDRTLN